MTTDPLTQPSTSREDFWRIEIPAGLAPLVNGEELDGRDYAERADSMFEAPLTSTDGGGFAVAAPPETR